MSPHSTEGPSLLTRLGPLTLAHPLLNASGTLDLFEADACLWGVGTVDGCHGPAERPPVAAYVPKTVTLEPRRGNEPPRILETASGMLNSIGLPNMGLDAFIEVELPRLSTLPCPVILNIGGFAPGEYVSAAERLCEAIGSDRSWVQGRSADEERGTPDGTPAAARAGEDPAHGAPPWTRRVGLELNVSCPNVHSGCMSFGTDAGETGRLVGAVRGVWPGLLMVKLTPNVTDIASIARAAVEEGADALSLVNTFKGLALDRVSLRPYLGGVTGGLSGPAIKPLALRCLFEVAAAVRVPLVGMGGVRDVQDVLDFLACGATAVAVGAAGFRDPLLPARLAAGLRRTLSMRGLSLTEVVGCAHR